MNRLTSLDQVAPSSKTSPQGEENSGQGSVPQLSLPRLQTLCSPSLQQPQRFVLPSGYEPNYRYPLVVWLHADGYNENQIAQVMPHISTQNHVGVGIRGSRSIDPAGHRFDWSQSSAAVARSADAIWQAVDTATERYSIHPQRIFLAGYAEGGTMARRIALQHPGSFAGCISLGGRFPRGGAVLSNLAAARNLRHFWAVGTESEQVSPAEFTSDVELISAARLKMEIRRYTVADEMVREILADVDRWIMGHINSGTADPQPLDPWGSAQVSFSGN
ncbi:MAG: hypothetical protein EA381_06390 [Planctomycetaceae bacterium]|nr:MAG: hypothetical protein EA381_06390 [Planctomycetaceae bacterium]